MESLKNIAPCKVWMSQTIKTDLNSDFEQYKIKIEKYLNDRGFELERSHNEIGRNSQTFSFTRKNKKTIN